MRERVRVHASGGLAPQAIVAHGLGGPDGLADVTLVEVARLVGPGETKGPTAEEASPQPVETASR
jgi:hypothetical protein